MNKCNREKVDFMKFGLCTPVSNLKMAADLGYDYIEPSVTGIVSMEEEEFRRAVEEVGSSPIKCEVCNILFRPDIRLTGEGYNEDLMAAYLDKAFARIIQLGTKAVVLGSGGARRVPPDFDMAEGRRQFLRAAKVVGDIAAKYDLVITLEPLNQKETNLLLTVKEGIDMVKELNHPNVKLLADFYHMRMEEEPMSILESAGELLQHTHIAKGHERTYPLSRDEDIYDEFFTALHNAGYDSRISVEGRTEDIEKDAPVTLSLLKELRKHI
jgi:D-psicose/D-tagatose/L-ribulose 3-epimerase